MRLAKRIELRHSRKRVVYWTSALLAVSLAIWVVWSLRALILPCIIGLLLAYVSGPLLDLMKRRGIPHMAAIAILFGGVLLGVGFLVNQVRTIIPDERGKLVLRARVQYKLNQRYDQLMGFSGAEGKGNFVYSLFGRETDPMVANVNKVLALDEQERVMFRLYHEGYRGAEPIGNSYYEYHLQNIQTMKQIKEQHGLHGDLHEDEEPEATISAPPEEKKSTVAELLGILSLWVVTPFVFLFLLMDEGEIKRWTVRFVPNKYFEMFLTTLHNVDIAIGKYLRGTTMECGLVGLTFAVCLYLVGFEFEWAVIIGLLAGVANAIPFLGPVIGLVIGAGYALIAEEISAPIPFFTAENLVIGVFMTVGVAQLLDNAVFQPVVLGGAVNLHPLVVVIGVMAGSIMFGFAGMLFAIPTIVVVRVVVSTLFKQLHAYYII